MKKSCQALTVSVIGNQTNSAANSVHGNTLLNVMQPSVGSYSIYSRFYDC